MYRLVLRVLVLQCLLHDTSLSDSLNVEPITCEGTVLPLSSLPGSSTSLPFVFTVFLETGHLHGSPCEKSVYQNYSFRSASIEL